VSQRISFDKTVFLDGLAVAIDMKTKLLPVIDALLLRRICMKADILDMRVFEVQRSDSLSHGSFRDPPLEPELIRLPTFTAFRNF
jgi:hypothetical protein